MKRTNALIAGAIIAGVALVLVAVVIAVTHTTPNSTADQHQATSTTTVATSTSTPATSKAAAITSTTTGAGTTTTATTTTCQSVLAAVAATAGSSTTSPTPQTIVFTSDAALANPTVPSGTAPTQSLTVPFIIYGANGTPVPVTKNQPVTISIYDAPAGAIETTPAGVGTSPIVVTISSGSSFSLTYHGNYLSRPLTVTATQGLGTTNVCTKTPSYAIGSTSLTLENRLDSSALGTATYTTPTICSKGTSGNGCAALNVSSKGLALMAAVGYGAAVPSSLSAVSVTATTSQLAPTTVDTGSIGTVVPYAKLGPDAIGPGSAAMKYYDSSGNEFLGFTYLAPVTLKMGASQVTTVPIRVLAVVSSACHPDKPCHGPPPFANFHYLGVGFDRSGTNGAGPFVSPRDNAFLAVEPSQGDAMSQGYILTGSSITLGITASNGAGYSSETLSLNPNAPGDWLAPPVCVTFPPSTTPVCGSMLLDVGIPQMYITFQNQAAVPAAVASGLKPNQMISIASPNGSTPVLSYRFSSGPVAGGKEPPTTGMAPSSIGMSVAPSSSAASMVGSVFINTGRHVLFENQYLYNAQSGQVGFLPFTPPLR